MCVLLETDLFGLAKARFRPFFLFYDIIDGLGRRLFYFRGRGRVLLFCCGLAIVLPNARKAQYVYAYKTNRKDKDKPKNPESGRKQ